MQVPSKQARFDVHRAITDIIVAAIEVGVGEFILPWHSASAATGRPENARTKMHYHGVNVLALWANACINGYASGYWASYRQWLQLGAQVRSGEHGATIVFFKNLEANDTAAEESGEESGRNRLVAWASRVFNADQVEGWQPPSPQPAKEPARMIESASAFVEATKAAIYYSMHDGAFYDIRNDTITLPHPFLFRATPTSSATEELCATTFHELVHWSGAAHRLGRKLTNVTKPERAMEELVAEIGAAFLCADLGVTNTPRPQHAAYIASWLELLKSDVRAVFTASRLAHQAAIYLHGFSETASN